MPFDFARLREQARALARKPYEAPHIETPSILEQIDFDAIQKIRFRPSMTLFAGTSFPVRLFHLSKYAQAPVAIYALENGQAREVRYAPDYFDYGDPSLVRRLPANLGFAGFRFMNDGHDSDWLAFQGASYFRSAGPFNQYGLSARGIAIDVATPEPEEFPAFRAFWIEPGHGHGIRLYALLDGPSLTGAYRFDCMHTQGTVMDVHTELFVRKPIARLGVAPLTSMFWYGENNREEAKDWRPEIHDSDGLALWTGAGERFLFALIDPSKCRPAASSIRVHGVSGCCSAIAISITIRTTARSMRSARACGSSRAGHGARAQCNWWRFPPTTRSTTTSLPTGFQRGRSNRGRNSRSIIAGTGRPRSPFPHPRSGRVVATRIGRGGVPGQTTPRDPAAHKFVIDFEGGALAELAQRYDVEPVVTATRGKVGEHDAIKIVGTHRWRGVFDLDVPGTDPVELRCFLRLKGRTLTETWLYRYLPAKQA